MSFLKSIVLLTNETYQSRVRAAMYIQAYNVAIEPPSGDSSIDVKRHNLIKEVMLNQDNRRQFILDDFLSLTIGHPDIQQIIKNNPNSPDLNSLIDDETIQLVIEDLTNVVAGININNPKL